MSQPQPRIEVAAIDSFVLRLFERIDEANMPWLLAAEENLRAAFGAALLDLVPSYTTLLLQYDLLQLDPGEARARIAAALSDLRRNARTAAACTSCRPGTTRGSAPTWNPWRGASSSASPS